MSDRIHLFPFLVIAALACRRAPPPPEPVIVGEVIDNFGHPVQGAVLTIRDSAFRATTNARGEFTMGAALLPSRGMTLLRRGLVDVVVPA